MRAFSERRIDAHGHPRATKDLDVWVEPSPENAERVLAALREFGAPLGSLTVEDLTSPGVTYQIGVPPLRIDVLTAIDGVADFAAAWKHRRSTVLDGLPVVTIGRRELLKNKRAAARPQDLADVAALERSPRKRPRVRR
ncbi:MAG TPA: hypothetical protein VIG99_02705 [Myxococcaceae bacterium]